MKKSKLSQTQTLLLVIGLSMNIATQIIMHYYTLPDLVAGLLIGAGIGIMLSALRWKKQSSACILS